MKAVLLAGGLGTRISEESHLKPKPMIEVGGRPILWHIMKLYSHYGFDDFIVCLGYKGYVVKEYFANYVLHNADLTVDLITQRCAAHTCSLFPRTTRRESLGEASGALPSPARPAGGGTHLPPEQVLVPLVPPFSLPFVPVIAAAAPSPAGIL